MKFRTEQLDGSQRTNFLFKLCGSLNCSVVVAVVVVVVVVVATTNTNRACACFFFFRCLCFCDNYYNMYSMQQRHRTLRKNQTDLHSVFH